ncbi:MAG: EAL domain-containing protein [Pseudomonadota bacterium]
MRLIRRIHSSVNKAIARAAALAIAVFGQLALADHAHVAPLTHDIYFESLDSDWLTQSTVTAIFQDSQGFLWFGTESGLNRYDGAEVIQYVAERGNDQALADDFVWDIEEDRDGRIWIATDSGGVAMFDPKTEQFDVFRHDPSDSNSIRSNAVRSLAIEGNTVWIGTRNDGVSSLDTGTMVFTHWSAQSELGVPDDARVFDISFDDDAVQWVATNQGLYRYDANTRQSTVYSSTADSDLQLSDDSVVSIAHGSDGTTWVGTIEGGLNAISADGEIQHYRSGEGATDLPSNYVRDLLEDSDGRLWVATTQGLSLFDRRTGTFITYRADPDKATSLGNDHTLVLQQDHSGMLWVGTRSGGVSNWNPRSWAMGHLRYEPLDGAMITSFATKPSGLWIGTMGRGLFYKPAGEAPLISLDDIFGREIGINNAMSMLIDDSGLLWVGTMNSGVHVLDLDARTVTNYQMDGSDSSGLRSNGIMSITQHPSGKIWVGTFGGGISIIDHGTRTAQALGQLSSTGQVLGSARVTALSSAPSGDVWIATDGNGLFQFESASGALRQFVPVSDDATTLASDRLYSVYFDAPSNTVWVGTGGAGLDRLKLSELSDDGRGFKNFSKNDGLADNAIYGILPDATGALWLSSNNGITRFDPTTGESRVFHSRHGLQSDEFNFGSHHRASDGTLIFGGSNGFNAFNPNDISEGGEPPRVALSHVSVDEQRVEFDPPGSQRREIVLPYDHSVLSFGVSVLDFVDPRKNQIQFRLNGFEEQWRTVASGNAITYTNLDAGDYQFEVIGVNSEGTASERTTSIVIRVERAPWATPLAYALYGLAALVLIRLGFGWQRKRIERRAEIHRLSNHDHVTGLPNRRCLIDSVDALRGDDTHLKRTSILVVSFNHVDRISDSFGLDAGDQTLRALANRLLSSCTEVCGTADTHIVARVGAEEFAIVIHDEAVARYTDQTSKRLLRQFSDARVIGGGKTSMSVTVGIAHAPQHGPDAESLLRNARAAVHVARGTGQERCLEFSPEINDRLRDRLTMEEELRLAIEFDQLVLHLQPKFEAATLRLVGAEALVRWQHPKRGMVPPGAFIPLAEDTGIITDIGMWVSKAAAARVRQWIDAGIEPVPIAINLSGVEVSTAAPARALEQIARSANIEPHWLDVELTETLIMQDAESTKATLEGIKALGCRISIDDFGTGYSSLAYLKRFPVDKLKIDRSFIKDLEHSDEDRSICAAVIAMAHSLNLQVVAEGVETDEQLRCLVDLGCDQIQGFLLGRPTPEAEFDRRFLVAASKDKDSEVTGEPTHRAAGY